MDTADLPEVSGICKLNSNQITSSITVQKWYQSFQFDELLSELNSK